MRSISKSCSWVAVLPALLLLSGAGLAQTATDGGSAAPRVFLYDGAMLAKLKSAAAIDPRRQDVVRAARTAADKAMTEGPFAVTQKAVTPPSGDKHDYMSQAPYF